MLFLNKVYRINTMIDINLPSGDIDMPCGAWSPVSKSAECVPSKNPKLPQLRLNATSNVAEK